MNGTGIVRRVDDLGRIVLPKEIRRKLGINEGTPREIYASADSVTMKKYYPENELSSMAAHLQEAVEEMCVDLGPEKTGDIRRHIWEIQMLFNTQIFDRSD